MMAAEKLNLVSVEDYLAGELESPVKHEYVAGAVYAMAGARNMHNVIVGNLYGILFGRLRGSPCRPFNSDTKVRIALPTHLRFYYPDVSVVCRQNPLDDSFQDEPVAVFEVLSKRTRRIDAGEKKDAYLTIASLQAYVMVEQDEFAVVVFRRTKDGFQREVLAGREAVLSLPQLGIDLPLSEIYEGVELIPEQEADDAIR